MCTLQRKKRWGERRESVEDGGRGKERERERCGVRSGCTTLLLVFCCAAKQKGETNNNSKGEMVGCVLCIARQQCRPGMKGEEKRGIQVFINRNGIFKRTSLDVGVLLFPNIPLVIVFVAAVVVPG